MSARDKILGRICHNLGRGPLNEEAATLVRDRIAGHQRNLVPARTSISHGRQVNLLQDKLEALAATAVRVPSLQEVPGEVRDYLSNHNLPSQIKMSPSPSMDDIPWGDVPMLEITRGAAVITDEVSITPAFAAIAETGTLCMASGPDTPSTLNFLPENHIVVLKAGDIQGSFEDVWDRLRQKFGEAEMPRTVNFISGPSRTADIEQQLIMGAHGPRRLHIVIVEDEQKT